MGRHTIFDAFQAAARTTETVLNAVDKQLMLNAELEVQDAALKDREAFDQFMLDMQNSGDWQNYEKNWEDFKVKTYNTSSKNLSSPYAKRIYDMQFKENEMKQRLTIKSVVNQKMRLENFTKGFDYINTVIQSNSFADTEETGEDGVVYKKTAALQKKELIDKKLNAMYEAGLLRYDELNQTMRDSYVNLTAHDMISAGKKSVDEGASIEEVISNLQGYKNTFRTIAGGTVTEEAVKAKATEEVERYFYKMQAIRFKNGEQQASVIYKKMSDALAKGDWDGAYKASEEGRNFLSMWDNEYGGRGFDPNVRDEYSDKFMLKDNVKIAGTYGGLVGLQPEEEVNFYLQWMKKGWKDKDGNFSRVTFNELVNRINGEIYEAKKKIQGEAAAMSNTYKVLSKLQQEISKPPFCNQGVAGSVKNVESAIKQVLSKDKNFSTLEGQAHFTRVLGETLSQVYDYLEKTEYDTQKPDDIANIIACQAIKIGEANNSINDHWIGNDRKQNEEAVQIAKNIAAASAQGSFGEDLESKEIKQGREYLLNYVFESEKKATGRTTKELQDNFLINGNEDGSFVVIDKKAKEATAVYTRIIDENGKEIYKRHTVSSEVKDGEKKTTVIPDEKTPGEIKKEREQEERTKRTFEKVNNSVGSRDTLVPGRKKREEASEEYKNYVYNLSKEDRLLFQKVRDECAASEDFTSGKISRAEQEKRIIEEFEYRKKHPRSRRF